MEPEERVFQVPEWWVKDQRQEDVGWASGWMLGALGVIGESRGEGPEAAELSAGSSGLAAPGPRMRYFRQ